MATFLKYHSNLPLPLLLIKLKNNSNYFYHDLNVRKNGNIIHDDFDLYKEEYPENYDDSEQEAKDSFSYYFMNEYDILRIDTS